MKHKIKTTFMKDSADLKTTPWKFRVPMLICIVLVSCLLAVILHNWGAVSAKALEIPSDYGTGYEIGKLNDLQNGEAFEGIKCVDKSKNEYTLLFSDTGDVNGLVTLARISHNSDLEGYTFQISYSGIISLDVKYGGDGKAVSAGSFFGIGNGEHPFKGKIVISGGADKTYIVIKENGWKYLFNNISNEASITNEGNYRLYSSYDSSASVDNPGPGTVNSFAFCKTLTVTKDGCALNLSGYNFGNDDSMGNTGALVQGNGKTALFACEVKKTEGASSFSVDLSKSLSSGEYIVASSDDDAGGLIGSVEAGVSMEIGLPDSLNFKVTSGGEQKNAGILIGSNNGNVTFKAANTEDVLSFTGKLDATGSAGLIGANEDGSTAVFNNKILIDGLQATGLRAGGIAGTSKGKITVKFAEVKNSTFTKIESTTTGRLGGAIGGVDNESGGLIIAEGGSIKLSGNTFSVENAKACYIGGYIGGLTTAGGAIDFLSISNTTITGSGSDADKIGGCIGYLETSGDFSVSLENDTTFTFNNITQGICGGVIGDVKSSKMENTVELKGKGESNSTINCTVNNSASATVGGLVGKVTSGYLKTDNLSLNNTIVRANNAADLVGIINADAMLDVGNITIKEANGSVLVGKTGKGSVVRLSGNITDSSSSVLNLVYEQNSSLIYKDNGCSYSGNPSTNNDIGNYGQVVRNDTLQVIEFNETTHKVSLKDSLDGSGDINITGAADFAKLAITFHTKGTVSGVTDITNANYSSLYGKTINLAGDVSLVNTGIEQLTPPNDMTVPFTGTVNGGGYTITLDIGQNISEAYPGIKAGSNNARSSLGLFAYIQNITVENVKIGGQISLCLPDANQYVGSLAGKADGTLALKDCEVDTAITVANGVSRKSNNTSLYIGGIVGYIGDISSLSVTGCTLGARITDSTSYTAYNSTNNKLYLGGLGGYVKYTGSSDIDFKNNIIKTNIAKSSAYTNLKMGGFIGELVCSNYVKADLSGTTANGVSLTAASVTDSAGGILGHTFDKCHVILNGTYTGTVSAGSASLGGLLYTLNGRLTVNEDFSLTGTSLTSTGEIKGLLLADGKTALVTVKSAASGFSGVTTDDGFDLFVGENITEYTSVNVAATGGIVTVETNDGLGKLADSSSGWYALINDRTNTKTRYYFNIAGLENQNVSETVSSATDLIYWNVYDYAQALPDYVKTKFFKTAVNNITSVTANINMSGYCFYPTKKEAVTIDFKNHSLTFGKPAHVAATNQFFGLQAGLLSDVYANSATTVVSIQNIKLSGTSSYLGGSVPGSGALICGTVYGSQNGNNRYDVKLTLSNAVISGLSVEGSADYRPLLINRIGSYVDATVSDISQADYPSKGAKAASSLIGKGGFMEGAMPSSYIKMTLSSIVLDGNKNSTIFTKATLFYDVSYVSGSGSFIYNFNFDEDWESPLHQVTYGAELSLNGDQRTYFDKNIPVRPDSKPTASSSYYEFQNNYLPYVFVGYDKDTGNVNLLLSVNRKGADFIEGWGTYRNPYIINSAKQLEYLAKLLSGNNESFSDGWQIKFPQGDWSSVSSLNLTNFYLVQANGGKLYYGDTELSRELLLAYLSGAYFKIDDDTTLTLSSGYAGLGSANYPFHGVIHGNGNTLIMSSNDTAIGAYGYGFINVANGCAVYSLTINYGNIVLSSDEFSASDTATSGPVSGNLSTSLPHFGGVIAWVVGGDNLIDQVTVSVTSVDAGACHTVFGGYVGLISGGGVLLSGLKEDLTINDANHLYHNNYIGRVLSGYAIAIDGVTYNNGKSFASLGNYADFVIPAITKDTLTTHNKGFSSNTFTLENAQDLLLFSFGMNSGAFAGNNGYGYGQTSLSRFGDYSHVGVQDATGVTDGKYIDDTNKISILLKYFGIATQTDLRNTSTTVKLTGTEYDMTAYGNAFRGMSGVYSNSPTYKIAFFGKDSGTATVKLDMDMMQYAVGKKDGNDASYFEADSIRNYGLFGSIGNEVTFQNITLTGNLSVRCITVSNAVMESDPFLRLDIGNGCSVGGLAGLSNGAVTVTNASLNGFALNSPDVCGGFVGRHAKGDFTVNGCSYKNATIKGKRHTGGVTGYVNAGTVLVTGIAGSDSVIETRVDLQYQSGTLYGAAGGIIGYVDGSTKSVTLTNCRITKTAAVYTANYKNTGDYVAAGGLVGLTRKDLTATDCTVDGCVVLAVSNFTSGYKFPDTLTPSGTNTLSDSFKNAVVYNGENQNVANLLAWMMEQKANDSNGYAVGAAGGILGVTRNSATVTLTGCTVSCVSAPSVIIAFNDAGGLVGEQRDTGAGVTITDCTVTSGNHDMYIIGGPRAAGGIAYRHTSGVPTYKLSGVQITGTPEHPIRILGAKYHLSDAAGLIGDINKVNLTAENCKVSYCIIGGSKAAGAWSNVNSAGTTIIFNNIDISNNLIYSKNYSTNTFYAGGLFCNTNASSAVNGAYIGNNYIVGVIGAGGLAGQLQSGNTLNAKYVILDDNVIRKITNKVSNFTFAAKSLTDGEAATALINSSNFSNVGLIAGNNAGTVTAIAVSCNAPDAGETKQKNFGTGGGTGTVVYAAYGAGEKYTDGNIEGVITPQQAIEEMKYTALIDSSNTPLYGDSVTSNGTPETVTPQIINGLTWWPYKEFTLGDTAITKLNGLVTGTTVNSDLPLFCLNEKTDETMKGYLNMLTGGGFDDAVTKGIVTVGSKRYSVDENGKLTDLGESGSVVLDGSTFKVGVYDNLEGETKTLTVLTVTFKDSAKNDVYTMHLAIYYHRAVNIKTFVVPLEGEHYYVPSFLNFTTEPTGALRTNVSYGSPFTLYVEYNYNDMAMKLEQMTNFNKQIELTGAGGLSDASAGIESGTVFVLIDLNSETPAGYTYYTLELSEKTQFIDFNSFTNGEKKFTHIDLTYIQNIVYQLNERVCKDTSDCVYTEKYILAVFPIQNDTDSAFTYNMKAVIDEQQREETNIVVKYPKSVYAQVSVWGSPTVEQTSSYNGNSQEDKQFSNLDKPIKMNIYTKVEFPKNYISSLGSTFGSSVYGTHILQLRNGDNRYVELPTRTVFKVTLPDGTEIREELTEPTSRLRFSVGNLLDKAIIDAEGVGTVEMNCTVELDFSSVNPEDFYNAFYASGKSKYTLEDSIYISGNEELQSGEPLKNSNLEYTVDTTGDVKLSVVPDDNRYLGININNPDDETNSGKIGFTVSANFDSFAEKEFSNVTVSFSVHKKVYEDGRYKYIEPNGSEFLTWNVYKGNEVIEENKVMNSDSLTKTDNSKEYTDHYLLELVGPFESSDLTNYRLVVTVSATDTGGETVKESEYFVFLLCNLNTEIS